MYLQQRIERQISKRNIQTATRAGTQIWSCGTGSVCLTACYFIFYEHSVSDLELQRPPVEHVPRSVVQIIHVVVDFTWREDIIPHVDVRHHADKRLLQVEARAVGILLLCVNQTLFRLMPPLRF